MHSPSLPPCSSQTDADVTGVQSSDGPGSFGSISLRNWLASEVLQAIFGFLWQIGSHYGKVTARFVIVRLIKANAELPFVIWNHPRQTGRNAGSLIGRDFDWAGKRQMFSRVWVFLDDVSAHGCFGTVPKISPCPDRSSCVERSADSNASGGLLGRQPNPFKGIFW